ncbi:MAG: cytochrome c [Ilumatobacteraceae bacterium]
MTRVGVAAGYAALALVAATFAVRGVTTSTAASTAPLTTSTTATVVSAHRTDGAQLFRSKGCATCHTGPDSTARFDSAPSLADAAAWAASREPGVSATDYLAESMLAPSTFISPAFHDGGGPMTGMPDLGLSPDEVDALIDYLLHP